jgi:hypothetical protein
MKHYILRYTISLILFGIMKNCTRNGRCLLLYHFTRTVIELTVVTIESYQDYQLHTKFYPISSQGQVHIEMELLGIISVGFDITDQLLIRLFAFVRYWRKNESTMRQYIIYL